MHFEVSVDTLKIFDTFFYVGDQSSEKQWIISLFFQPDGFIRVEMMRKRSPVDLYRNLLILMRKWVQETQAL